MPAFFVATVSVKNPEKMKEYAAKSGPTFAAFGGTLLARGGLVRILWLKVLVPGPMLRMQMLDACLDGSSLNCLNLTSR